MDLRMSIFTLSLLSGCVIYTSHSQPCQSNSQCNSALHKLCDVTSGSCICKTGFYSKGYDEKQQLICSGLGAPCTYSRDCADANMTCSEQGTCTCSPIHYLSDPYSCRKRAWRSLCSEQSECEQRSKGMICEQGWCICHVGSSYYWNQCHNKHDTWCGAKHITCFDYMGYYCDVRGRCQCHKGTKQSPEGCREVLGMYCETQKDCDGTGLVCRENRCLCAPGSMPVKKSDNYFSTVFTRTFCLPVLNLPCDDDNLCNVQNGGCDPVYGRCVCDDGFVPQDTQCVQVLGTRCEDDSPCMFVTNATCTEGGICDCKPGFMAQNRTCIKVLGNSCEQTDDCHLMHAICGTDNTCICDRNTSEFNDQCLVEACHLFVPRLPDFPRRLRHYNLGVYEPYVTDRTLSEGWYSAPSKYRMSTLQDGAEEYDCGTRWPIVRKDDGNFMLEDGNEAVFEAKVIGHGDASDDVIIVRMRRCGSDMHYHLQKPNNFYTAYCFEYPPKQKFVDPGRFPYYSIASTWDAETLEFRVESINGTLFDVPHAIFKCVQANRLFEDLRYYHIVWFFGDTQVRMDKPIIGWQITQWQKDQFITTLSDEELAEQGYHVNGSKVKVRCGLQVSSSPFSRKSLMLVETSARAGPGDNFHDAAVYITIEKENYNEKRDEWFVAQNLVSYYPLGCTDVVNSMALTCELHLDLIDNDGKPVCINPSADGARMCGITLLGVTKAYITKKIAAGGIYGNPYQLLSGARTGTIGTLIRLRGNTSIYSTSDELHGLETSPVIRLKLAVNGRSTGHKFWEKTILPDVYINIGKEPLINPPYKSFKILEERYLNSPRIRFWSIFNDDLEPVLSINAAGDYLLYRTSYYPFEVQMTVTDGKGCYLTKYCICAVTILKIEDVYTMDFCNREKPFVGLLAGSGRYLTYQKHSKLIVKCPGQLIEIKYDPNSVHYPRFDMEFNGDSYQLGVSQERTGLGAATDQMGRFGYEPDEEAFTLSWRVPWKESLRNSATHVRYRTTQKIFSCGCPDTKSAIPDRVPWSVPPLVQIAQDVIGCDVTPSCEAQSEGFEWKRLEFNVIDKVSVKASVGPEHNGEPSILFKCHFYAPVGFKYTVYWFVEDISYKESDVLDAHRAREFTISDVMLLSDTRFTFDLQTQIKCGVTLRNSSGQVLVDTIYSNVFTPLEISPRTFTIRRGQDALLHVNLNIPLICTDSSNCALEYKLVNQDETQCSESIITLKSSSNIGCGAVIPATTSGKAATLRLSLANNNKYSLQKAFTLDFRKSVKGKAKMIYSSTYPAMIRVKVVEHESWMRKSCHLLFGRHLKTADGTYFENKEANEFVVLSHKLLPMQVQVVTKPCYNSSMACACAVTMRAGGDIFTINHCEHHLTDFLAQQDHVLTVTEINSQLYEVLYPTGTTVLVHVLPELEYTLSVDIHPSPRDFNNVEGLCGNFNGNASDDIPVSITTTTTYDFPMSWSTSRRLGSHSSLLDPDVFTNPGLWPADSVMCVCSSETTLNNSMELCSFKQHELCPDNNRTSGRPLGSPTQSWRGPKYVDSHHVTRLAEMMEKWKIQAAHYIPRSEESPVAMHEEEGMDMCKDKLDACWMTKIIAYYSDVIKTCAKDLMLDGRPLWVPALCRGYTHNLLEMLKRDEDYQNAYPSHMGAISDVTCPADCSNNGVCIHGKCRCNDGYDTDTCLVDMSTPPAIHQVTGEGMCIVTEDNSCRHLLLVGEGFTSSAVCKMSFHAPNRNGIFVQISTSVTDCDYINPNEVIVAVWRSHPSTEAIDDVPEVTYDVTNTVSLVALSASNDGVNFGSEQIVVILNSSCHSEVHINMSGEHIAQVKEGFCYVDDQCVENGTQNARKPCLVCQPSNSQYKWSQADCLSDVQEVSTDIMLIIVGAASAGGVIIVAIVIWVVWQWSRRSSKMKNCHRELKEKLSSSSCQSTIEDKLPPKADGESK